MDSRLKNALRYAETGWPVFPVTEKKLPAIKNWENKATTDPRQIKAWFEDLLIGGCNFGFTPGRAGIAVIDLDKNKIIDGKPVDGEGEFNRFCVENLLEFQGTYTVRTPSGGLHLYYRASGIRSKNAFLPAVDVKSCGGYVVIPGSVSQKGKYRIEKDLPVKDIPEEFLKIYGHKKTEKSKPQISYNTQITPDTDEKIEAAKTIIEEWPEAQEGERNDNLFRMMRELCKAGISAKEAEALYAEEGIQKIGLDPDSTEVSATIKSAYGDLSDLGSESEEGRRLAVRLFDDGFIPAGESGSGRFGADWSDLAAMKVPDRRWFIENWLSADEGYTVLFSGRGGTGKSALMLDLMRSLATGDPWCGMEIKRGAKSMYVGCEDSEEEIARRIQNRSVLGTPVPKGVVHLVSRLGCNNLICSSDKSGKLKKEPFYEDLKKNAKEFFGIEGGVLILDTASDIFAGNEVDRSQVSQFVKGLLNRLGKDVGVTIILLAHPSKKASTDGQGYSGSTAWEGAFRCRWELNYKDPGKVDGLLELVLAKSNTTKAGKRITLENVNGMFAVVDGMKVDETVKDVLADLIADAFDEGEPFGKGAQSERPICGLLLNDPVTGGHLTSAEIKRIVDEMLAEGRIVQEKEKGGRRFLKLNEKAGTQSEKTTGYSLKKEIPF